VLDWTRLQPGLPTTSTPAPIQWLSSMVVRVRAAVTSSLAIMKVSGVVLLERSHPEFDDAVLRVRLLDVSQLDAPSVTMAEVVVRGVSHRKGEERALPFFLETSQVPAPGADLTVAAHLERVPATEPSAIRRGDLLTTTSNPVQPSGAEGIILRLTQV
jgi:putative lipoprotein